MRRLSIWPVIALLLVTLSACSLNDKKTPAPASTSSVAPAVASTSVAGLDPAASQTITDGFCTALIPDAWVDLGNGRGTSPSGARFTLFGNKLASDAAWTAASGVVATIAAGGTGKVDQAADSIAFTREDGSSYEMRRRLSDRYCDFSITVGSAAPAEERALWPQIGATMAPVTPATP